MSCSPKTIRFYLLSFLAVIVAMGLVPFVSTAYLDLSSPLVPGLDTLPLPASRGLLFLATFLLVLAGLRFLRFPRGFLPASLAALLVGAQVFICCATLVAPDDSIRVPWSIDTPSFMFRIAQALHSFPWLEPYIPFWNAGLTDRVLVSTTAYRYAQVTAPLFALHPSAPHLLFFPSILAAFVFLVPWLHLWAFRAARLSWTTSLLGSILSIAPNSALCFYISVGGNVGFALSASMACPAMLFLFGLSDTSHPPSLLAAGGLVVTTAIMLSWFPLALPFAFMTALALWDLRHAFSPRHFCLLGGAAVLVVLLHIHPSLVFLHDLVNVAYRLKVGGIGPGDSAYAFTTSQAMARALVPGTHPLLLVLGLAGILFSPGTRLRRWILVVALPLFLIGLLGPVVSPRLCLLRLLIVVVLLFLPEAACWGEHLLEQAFAADTTSRPWQRAFLGAALLFPLLLGIAATPKLLTNPPPSGIQPPQKRTPHNTIAAIRPFARWIRAHVPADHRLLFCGSVNFKFAHAHVAYLPLLAKREMLALDYYGFPPSLLPDDFPPSEIKHDPARLHDYLLRHGVSHVVAIHKLDKAIFHGQPDLYRSVAKFELPNGIRARVYEVVDAASIFQLNSGHVEATFNRLDVHLDRPNEEAVLAYNWSERFSCPEPAELLPEPQPDGETFIRIRPHGLADLTLRYHPRF